MQCCAFQLLKGEDVGWKGGVDVFVYFGVLVVLCLLLLTFFVVVVTERWAFSATAPLAYRM